MNNKTDKTDIAVQHAQDITTAERQDPTAMLMDTLKRAVDEGKDIDTVERLLNMSERIMDRRREEEFYTALRTCREEMPSIEARGKNETTRSGYARLADIQKTIVPVYTRHGFSLSFSTKRSELPDHICIVGELSHVCGFRRDFEVDIPLDMTGMKGSQNKTKVHGTGSAISYGQRYLTKLIFNLRVTDDKDDDDGNGAAGVEVIDENEAANLHALGDEVACDWDVFLEFFGVSKVENLPKRMLAKAIKMLEAKRNAQ